MSGILRVGVAVLVWHPEERGHILMGKRIGEHEGGTYSWPGGHVEYNETPVEAAKREVLEETDVELHYCESLYGGRWHHTMFDSGKQYITLYFHGPAVVGGPPKLMEPDKCEGWNWVSIFSLPQPLFGGLDPELIESLQRGATPW
jgi:8-oxo-dGTP diphosphatase